LIFTSDARLPRTRRNIGRYVVACAALMKLNPAVDGFVDRTEWL
jgi:hypothetical protein